MTPRPDALVVGAGIVGAACARALADDGLRVVLLDADFVGGGTTAAGMGHLVAMDDSEAQLALTSYSQRLWSEVLDGLPGDCEVDRCGTLWLAEDDEQMAEVHAKRARYASHGVDSRVVDSAEVARLEPRLRPGLYGALHVPGESVVYPPNVARHLAERARARGATVREGCRIARIESGAVVTSEGRRLEAGLVVNAAGTEAARLTPGLPVVPRKGHLLITDRHPGFCRHQLVELGYLRSAHEMTGESVAFNVQPRATGQLLIGSSRELVGWDASLNRSVLRRMLRRALDFLPEVGRLTAIRAWTGFRPATPDHLPLIGRWEATPGLWIAAGHEGLGITTALATGRILADLVAGRATAIDAAPFSPARLVPAAGAAG